VGDRHDRHRHAGRYREEERHHDDRLRDRAPARGYGRAERHPRGRAAAVPANHDDDLCRHLRHAADRNRHRRRRRTAPTARHRRGRRAPAVAARDDLHHAGDLYLSRTYCPHAQVPPGATAAGGVRAGRAPSRGRRRVTAADLLRSATHQSGRKCGMRRAVLLSFLVLLFCRGDALAQTWPSKPIRAIIPFAAGSATDATPRVVVEPLSARLGQPIVVENRGGAGTTIGAALVAKAEADGYTLFATSSAHTLVPTVYPSAPYDTAADFAAAVSLGSSPNVLVVSPAKDFKTAQDLVVAAKARPGSFNFASAGLGSATHLSAERFRMAAGFEAVHIPFRGGAEAITEVLAGRADFYFCPLGTA